MNISALSKQAHEALWGTVNDPKMLMVVTNHGSRKAPHGTPIYCNLFTMGLPYLVVIQFPGSGKLELREGDDGVYSADWGLLILLPPSEAEFWGVDVVYSFCS